MFQKTFGSDNHSGIHPQIFEALSKVNTSHSPSYGTDPVTEKSQKIFEEHLGPCFPFFVFNGTAANVLCVQAFLETYESVVCTEISHLNSDECGACEFINGNKLIPVPSVNGKLNPKAIEEHLIRLGDQHFSQVKMVSITQPTEYGTIYSLEELEEISKCCKKHNLYLHIDGARFIHVPRALKVDFKKIIEVSQPDALSFGGTKNGLLFGETVVVFKESVAKKLKYLRKQSLQLPSKMRFIASQFNELLGTNLWQEIAEQSQNSAQHLATQLKDIPEIKVTQPVQANSVFAIIPKPWTKPLKNHHFFYIWDETTWEVRWMMSYDTNVQEIDNFISTIHKLKRLTSPH